MKRNMMTLAFALLGSAAVVAGCSSSDSGGGSGGSSTGGKASGGSQSGGSQSGGSASGGSASGGSSGGGADLTPTATGYISNLDVGIMGAWYGYGDGAGYDASTMMATKGDCQTKGGFTDDQCSKITTPKVGSFDNTDGKMCTTGTVAKVIKNAAGTADYSDIWGAGIAFDFNNAGSADGGSATASTYDATKYGVTGIQFDIDNVPTGFRVELKRSDSTDNLIWVGPDGTDKTQTSPVKAGTNMVYFADFKGPFYAKSFTPVDPTKIVSLQFHIPTDEKASHDFSYCISNVKAIQ